MDTQGWPYGGEEKITEDCDHFFTLTVSKHACELALVWSLVARHFFSRTQLSTKLSCYLRTCSIDCPKMRNPGDLIPKQQQTRQKCDAAKNDENYHEVYLEQMSFVSINLLFVTARSSATFSKGKKDHSIISCRFCVMNVPLPSALRPPPPFVARGVRSVRDSRSILHLAGCKLCPPRSPSPVPPPLRSFSFFFGKFETKAKESGAIWHRMDSSPLSLPLPRRPRIRSTHRSETWRRRTCSFLPSH